MRTAILDGKDIIPVDDILAWGEWFGTTDRQLWHSVLPLDHYISTVFLGLDHCYSNGALSEWKVEDGLWFETMVFGPAEPMVLRARCQGHSPASTWRLASCRDYHPSHDCWRYATYDQAEAGHVLHRDEWIEFLTVPEGIPEQCLDETPKPPEDP